MVLPIEASMASRAHFDLVLSLTMAGITVLYIGFGLVRARTQDAPVCCLGRVL